MKQGCVEGAEAKSSAPSTFCAQDVGREAFLLAQCKIFGASKI